MKVTIVGYGMAGSRLARRLADEGAEVTIFGAEPHQAYNRILLSNIVSGKSTAEEIALPLPGPDVNLQLGTELTTIDPIAKTAGGLDYDALVFATGARGALPPIDGLNTDGERIHLLRDLDDAAAIAKMSAEANTALVLGGGLLGLEAARGLAGQGLEVTVVHASDYLMNRQLDSYGAGVLADTYRDCGVNAICGARTSAVAETENSVTVSLSDGRNLTADIMVVSCGITPNIELAQEIGVITNLAIVIDDQCRTNLPDVYAIGDCAEHNGIAYGLVAPAWEQADVVADILTDVDPLAIYAGSRLVTRLKAEGIDVAAMGSAEGTDGQEVISFADPSRQTYARLVIDNDRLVGAVLLGENPTVGEIVGLFDSGSPLPPDRRSLLLGRPSAFNAAAPTNSPICRCNNVSRDDVCAAHAAGAHSVEAVAKATQATTGCGSCRGDVAALCQSLSDSLSTTL